MVKKNVQNPVSTKLIKHTVDLGVAVDDDLVQIKEFVDYLRGNVKVN